MLDCRRVFELGVDLRFGLHNPFIRPAIFLGVGIWGGEVALDSHCSKKTRTHRFEENKIRSEDVWLVQHLFCSSKRNIWSEPFVQKVLVACFDGNSQKIRKTSSASNEEIWEQQSKKCPGVKMVFPIETWICNSIAFFFSLPESKVGFATVWCCFKKCSKYSPLTAGEKWWWIPWVGN